MKLGGDVTTLDHLQEIAAALLLGFALIALARAYARAWRTWRERTTGERFIAWTSLGAGAFFRFFLIPMWIATVFIGYRLTQQAADLVPASHYGLGASALYHAIFAFLPVDHDVLMRTNSLLGVMTMPLAGAFAARLWPERGAGPAFVALLAFTPLFLRNDNSDANNVPCLLWIFGSLVLYEEYLEKRALAALAGALSLAFMALVSRPEMPIVLPVLFTLLTFALRPARSPLRDWRLYALGAFGCLLATPHFIHVLTAQAQLYPNVAANALARIPEVLLEENTVLWPILFPQGIVVLAAAALVLPPYTDYRRRLLVAIAAVALLAVYAIDTCRANMARVHVPSAVFTCLLAAAGLARVWQLARHFLLRVVVIGALAASAIPSARMHWAATNEQAEEDFLKEALPALPKSERFVFIRLGFADLDQNPETNSFTHQHFPDYLLAPPRGRATLLTAGEFLRAPSFERPVYFHMGMRCYAHFRMPGVPPPHGEDKRRTCVEMEKRFTLEAVKERVVPNRGDVWIEYYPDAPNLKLGLYRVLPKS